MYFISQTIRPLGKSSLKEWRQLSDTFIILVPTKLISWYYSSTRWLPMRAPHLGSWNSPQPNARIVRYQIIEFGKTRELHVRSKDPFSVQELHSFAYPASKIHSQTWLFLTWPTLFLSPSSIEGFQNAICLQLRVCNFQNSKWTFSPSYIAVSTFLGDTVNDQVVPN